MDDYTILLVGLIVPQILLTAFLATGIYLVYKKIDFIGYLQYKQSREMYAFIPQLQKPLKPEKICISKNDLCGVNGVLITGECPNCGTHLTNKNNRYCGGCSRKINWEVKRNAN